MRKESLTRSLLSQGVLCGDSYEEGVSRKEGFSSRKESVVGKESRTRGVSYKEAVRATMRLALWQVSM